MKHLRILSYVDEVARAGSIRKAAKKLNVTASAMNRRITDLETELGTTLFERKARGVNLTAAGEIFVRYVRAQNGDAERIKSQIDDLNSMRRGVVRIACSQALSLHFLPRAVGEFRKQYPQVTFEVRVLDHEQSIAALAAYEVDLALVFRPPFLAAFQQLMTIEQSLVVVMSARHPLARHRMIRLKDCSPYPVALPDRSIGGRQLLEEAVVKDGTVLNVAVQANSFEMLRGLVLHADLISFQIEIGTAFDHDQRDLVVRPIDGRDHVKSELVLGQLRARDLPVPAAAFAKHLGMLMDGMRSRKKTARRGHAKNQP